ncbi:MAG: gliding motility protein GldN [Muricauda sp.]|jgi:gliding motility associated protien GldN|uniref:Gliding motility protein GldN n=1 Tax=Flagellimonas sp. MMG031 TaxID=3158549 RepID=A0AAU7MYU7_9FLAO|nr:MULTISPECIES: gliding motility protein GldN [unclassified Allomuricauda]MBO6532382.1 gliding motility protein GldN [Allomuricauda sp.]MBO6587549.1 gliding motility protein GldN [Allomuricauda sp.]MBO6617174.1 gliding motility protein GldN [Allomuricauda sp.]MBO6643815.1 gliding motility protein GldN [Allomuricauda sp.]MBO6745509.1 gliding motility protein GldN [Allomuricauda sp.]
MNWKNALLIGLLGILPVSIMAQANILNAKLPEDIGKKTQAQIEQDADEPLEYGYVDDRDILWSKTVWEIIDLDERVNFPLYYPTDTIGIGADRRSLYHVLMKNIRNGNLTEVYADSYFTEKRKLADLAATLSKVDTTDLGYEQVNAGEQVSPEFINKRDLTAADIEEYRIKGIWYFDKRQGELKYRLLGIAPVAPDVNFIDDESIDPGENKVELFWVWYPAARKILHDAKVYNQRNSARPISFDMLLNARRFNGVIYKEENVHEDREISDYIFDNALFQLLEAQRIKEGIRDREQDMWAY